MAINQITGLRGEEVHVTGHSSLYHELHIVDIGIRPELPSNVAMVRSGASDATVRVEFWDINGRTLLNSDDTAFNEFTVSSTAKSLAAFMVDDSLNAATTIPGIPNGAVGGRLLVVSTSAGGIAVNTGGTDDGTGTNGLETNKAPTTSGPLFLAPGDLLEFGRYRS